MSAFIVVGGAGRAGIRHTKAHRERGDEAVMIDPVFAEIGSLGSTLEEAIDRYKAVNPIVDICTPTGDHTRTMRRAYALGVRKFIVEKPAAITAADWRNTVEELSEARIFVVHNYLFSHAVRLLLEVLDQSDSPALTIESRFDKDRREESAKLRGADSDGVQPHVFRLEMPHQLYVSNAILGELSVEKASSSTIPLSQSSSSIRLPAHGDITLSGPRGTATLTSDLTRSFERWFRVTCADGSQLQVDYALGPESTLRLRRPDGTSEQLWEGPDDSLKPTLAAAANAFALGEPMPDAASASSALVILEQIDDAINAS